LRQGAAKLAAIMELVAHCPTPVLIHCTAGKDRTGIVVAVLLRAVGVCRRAVIEDYRATQTALPAIMARIPSELTVGLDPTVRQRLMGVPEQAITAVLDEVDSTKSGAQGWLSDAGVSANTLAAWTHRFTTDLRLCDPDAQQH
jgi:protein tyrosine/serine phosphatase